MNEQKIELKFNIGQIVTDVLADCNLISTAMQDEAMADIRANVAAPDSEETRSIICRAVTEGWGNVKSACQRYIKTGRSVDDNRLERIVKEVVYDENGGVSAIHYEELPLVLWIPNFNLAVTDKLKSDIHKYMKDYVMYKFLQNQVAEKSAEYKAFADGEDHQNILKDLNSRTKFTNRKPSWI